MRKACKVTGDTLKMIAEYIKPGITTAQLDEIIENYIRAQGCTPSFKRLYGFPASACISIDDVVVHGIPSNRELVEGQIVSIDVGAQLADFTAMRQELLPLVRFLPKRNALSKLPSKVFSKEFDKPEQVEDWVACRMQSNRS